MKRCSVEGCDKPLYGRGWCRKHYDRWRNTGTTDDPPQRVISICTVDGCDKRAISHGLCKMHRSRMDRTGRLELQPRVRKVCIIENCTKFSMSRVGYCSMHYKNFRKHGTPIAPGVRSRSRYARGERPEICIVDTCDKPLEAQGYCSTHYSNWRKWGTPYPQGQRLCPLCTKYLYNVSTGRNICSRCVDRSRRNRKSDPSPLAWSPLRREGGDLCEFVMSLTQILPDDDGCWLWRGRTYVRPFVSVDGVMKSPRRILYTELVEEIEPNMTLHPSCDNAMCVNPHHVWNRRKMIVAGLRWIETYGTRPSADGWSKKGWRKRMELMYPSTYMICQRFGKWSYYIDALEENSAVPLPPARRRG